MARAPLVSVVIPAYDYAEFLPAAIDSALAQDWPAVEVIVVDDGSTDATPEVIASYGDRIRSVRQENAGVAAAVATGIGLARGELLTLLGADDTWRPDRVRLLAEALEAHPEAGLAYGDMELVDRDGRVLAPSFRATTRLPALGGRPVGTLLRGNVVSGGAMMVRLALREHFFPFPDVAPWEDWWIALQVAKVADLLPIDAPVNRYREHDRNMNLGAAPARFAGLLRAEVPFRRWMLTGTDPALVTAQELADGLAALEGSLARVAAIEGGRRQDLVVPTPAEHADAAARRDAARAALAAGDAHLAVAHAVAAGALVPFDHAAHVLLDGALAALRERDADPVAVRGTLVAVHVEDVLDDPALLAAWAAHVRGDDDVTLAVGGLTAEVTDALVAAVAAAGLDGDDAPDLVAVGPADPALVAARVGRPCAAVLLPAGTPAPAGPVAPLRAAGVAAWAAARRAALVAA